MLESVPDRMAHSCIVKLTISQIDSCCNYFSTKMIKTQTTPKLEGLKPYTPLSTSFDCVALLYLDLQSYIEDDYYISMLFSSASLNASYDVFFCSISLRKCRLPLCLLQKWSNSTKKIEQGQFTVHSSSQETFKFISNRCGWPDPLSVGLCWFNRNKNKKSQTGNNYKTQKYSFCINNACWM